MSPEIIVFFVAMGWPTSQAAICPTGWLRFGETCYLVVTTPLTWGDASRECHTKKAELVLPQCQTEQDAIWEMFLQIYHGNPSKHIWIGCSDIEEEGKWHPCPLRSSSSDAYQNWKDDQPDNDLNGNADCAAMINGAGGRWGDRGCTERHFSACQLPADTDTALSFCLQVGTEGRLASPSCLVDHVVKELPVRGVVECGKACRSEPRCRSFNLLEEGPETMLCQLNNVARRQVEGEDSIPKLQNCYFFEM
ncbi:echinoidin-like [Patiria miniata]|uniref:C-type lectin domain-containing protein n=1 Tax=Patiria miniata TaxID=46514 RepID=A0A914BTB4_PATMI|nr:echinoidin-like [Patiria miniata]